MAFQEIDVRSLQFNPFDLIGSEWMLVTAGDERKANTMTASWGGLGVIWGKNAATIYVRQSRYTKELLDNQETFSLCFFGDSCRDALAFCGRVSGRDTDKIAESGLTLTMIDNTPAFEEARLVLVCRKVFANYLDPKDFVGSDIDASWYADKDYHTMYIGSIEKAYLGNA